MATHMECKRMTQLNVVRLGRRVAIAGNIAHIGVPHVICGTIGV
jgi:hypothetical protein